MTATGTATSSCPIPGSCYLPILEGYSSTLGGTIYSSMPGCTRIIYDHKFLLEGKNSPVARTPPCFLPQIPGVTSLAQSSLVKLEELKEQNESEEAMP
ncbi:PREDICTED: eukaryotic translation initiation factor 4E-binding protein 3, partial [Merops nubicus]|uniref:eukaryotic translation initiation factor 4E-binding protein 3 n=1 Tax=Merops nubicus TaxID=57421 RepID=UPI0004F08C10